MYLLQIIKEIFHFWGGTRSSNSMLQFQLAKLLSGHMDNTTIDLEGLSVPLLTCLLDILRVHPLSRNEM